MKLTEDLDVAWKNAFKPTPKNVELFLKSSRRTLGVIGATTFLTGFPWVLFGVVILQSVFEEFAVYIAEATKPDSPQQAIQEAASKIEEEAEVIKEVINSELKKDE